METVAESAAAKFHTSLNVTDLARTIDFYRLLLGCEPAKQRRDYAKFELAEPPLVLSLAPGRAARGGALNHFGLRVPDAETLVEIQRPLELGGIRTKREKGVECCYARQTKFRVAAPDRVLWEMYVLHEDLDERGGAEVPEIDQFPANEPSIARKVCSIKSANRFRSAFRTLTTASTKPCSRHPQPRRRVHAIARVACGSLPRSGGEIRLHGLTSDAPLTAPLPTLPGPAAAVEAIPPHREVVSVLIAAGFIQLQLETLSATAHFTVGGLSNHPEPMENLSPHRDPQFSSPQRSDSLVGVASSLATSA